MSSDKSYFLDDESDDDGSDSGSYDTCSFPLCFDCSVGFVSGFGSGVFLPTVVSFNCEVFAFFVFISKGVKSRVGQLIQMFLALKFLIFPPNFKTSFLVVVMV